MASVDWGVVILALIGAIQAIAIAYLHRMSGNSTKTLQNSAETKNFAAATAGTAQHIAQQVENVQAVVDRNLVEVKHAMSRHDMLDEEVARKVDEVIQQNLDQMAKIDGLEKNINGTVAQLIASRVHETVGEAVAAALEIERERVAGEKK